MLTSSGASAVRYIVLASSGARAVRYIVLASSGASAVRYIEVLANRLSYDKKYYNIVVVDRTCIILY
jgi:hypothetical protein